ncbi:MAG: glycerol-3-phosphate acyltransferase, partial [Patescibacteria group bacterium]
LSLWTQNLVEVLIGSAAIAGHMWSIFTGWDGGKGVATAAGVFLCIDSTVTGIATLTFLAVFVRFRYVSLGSLLGTLAAATAAVALGRELPTVVLTLFLVAFIAIRHRANIARMRSGTEPRVRLPWEQKQKNPS